MGQTRAVITLFTEWFLSAEIEKTGKFRFAFNVKAEFICKIM